MSTTKEQIKVNNSKYPFVLRINVIIYVPETFMFIAAWYMYPIEYSINTKYTYFVIIMSVTLLF